MKTDTPFDTDPEADGGSSAPASLDAIRVPGHLILFGHDPTEVRAVVVPRTRRRRTVRALRALAVTAVATPLAGLVPPHAPWAVGALLLGLWTVRRRFTERHTLLGVEGSCPRCGSPVEFAGPAPLGEPHPLPCESCHHESTLTVDLTR